MGALLQLQPRQKSTLPDGPGRVVALPTATPLIRDTLMTEIDMFVKLGDGPARNQMYSSLVWTMHLYGLRKVDLGQLIVRLEPKWLSIKAKQIALYSCCPECGQYLYGSDGLIRLLQFEGDTGWHHYGCRCGAYFKKWEDYDNV